MLTEGDRTAVAARLASLTSDCAMVDAAADHGRPQGWADPRETSLNTASGFVSAEQQAALGRWWPTSRGQAAQWDVVSTGTIDGWHGLVLVEAEAHANELKVDGKPVQHNPEKRQRIGKAIQDFDDAGEMS